MDEYGRNNVTVSGSRTGIVMRWATFLLAAAVFFVLSHYSVLRGDDKLFSLMTGHDYAPIRTWPDYLTALREHYVANNGRTADAVLMLFLAFCPKVVWDVANSAVFVLFLWLTGRLAGGRWWHTLPLTLAYVMLLFPCPGETMMWMAGSCNYMWSVTLTLAVMCLLSRQSGMDIGGKALTLMLCVVAGSMNESVSVSFLIGAVVWLIAKRGEGRGRFALCAVVAYAAGLAVILAAPGLWARLHGGTDINLNAGVGQMVLQRLLVVTTQSVRLVLPLLAACVVVTRIKRRGLRATCGDLLCAMWFGALAAVLLFGLFKDRIYTFYSVSSFLVVMRWVAGVLMQLRRLAPAVAGCAVAVVVWTAAGSFRAISDYRTFTLGVECDVLASADGVVAAHYHRGKHRFVAPTNYDSDVMCLYQHAYSAYYHKPNVQFLKPALLKLYRTENIENGAVAMPFTSSCPEVASRLLALADSAHCAVAVDKRRVGVVAENTVLRGEPRPEVALKDGVARLKRWYFASLGVRDDVKTCGVYYLDSGGVRYLVLPTIGADVQSIAIPVLLDGRRATLRFTRK